jgi:hypothetical protein
MPVLSWVNVGTVSEMHHRRFRPGHGRDSFSFFDNDFSETDGREAGLASWMEPSFAAVAAVHVCFGRNA